MTLRHRIHALLTEHAVDMTVEQIVDELQCAGVHKILRLMEICRQVERGVPVPRKRDDKLGPPMLQTWRVGPVGVDPAPGPTPYDEYSMVQRIVPAHLPAPGILPQALAGRSDLEMAWGRKVRREFVNPWADFERYA